jgi:nucleotide-binding universal stress UspA family protein
MGDVDGDNRAGGLARSQPDCSRCVLYPAWHSKAGNSFDVATAIAETYGARLVVTRVDATDTRESGPGQSPGKMVDELLDARERGAIAAPVDGGVVSAGTRTRAITTAVDRYDVDAVILPNGGEQGIDSRVAKRVDCDVLTVSSDYQAPRISSILAPIAGGKHSGGVVDAAGALADAHDAWVELLYVRTEDAIEQPDSLVEAATRRLEGVDTDSRIIEGGPVADTISQESDYYDVTVIGAPRKGRLRQFVFGSTARDVQRGASNAVVMVRRGSKPGRSLFSAPLE